MDIIKGVFYPDIYKTQIEQKNRYYIYRNIKFILYLIIAIEGILISNTYTNILPVIMAAAIGVFAFVIGEKIINYVLYLLLAKGQLKIKQFNKIITPLIICYSLLIILIVYLSIFNMDKYIKLFIIILGLLGLSINFYSILKVNKIEKHIGRLKIIFLILIGSTILSNVGIDISNISVSKDPIRKDIKEYCTIVYNEISQLEEENKILSADINLDYQRFIKKNDPGRKTKEEMDCISYTLEMEYNYYKYTNEQNEKLKQEYYNKYISYKKNLEELLNLQI